MDSSAPIKYLALGDSYTIGQSVASSDNYPNQLYARLLADDVGVEVPKIIARTGWTTGDLQVAIEQEEIATDYDLVSLLIGVNNQYRGRTESEYTKEFEDLLRQAIEFANGEATQVIVLSIPDYAYTPFGEGSKDPNKISTEIDTFNALNKDISETYNVRYFDITPISREGTATPALVADDGLHPSGEQYRRWVESIYLTVKEQVLMK